MGEWLVETVKYLLSNYKDIDIIVRAHPDEGRYKAKTTTKSLMRALYKTTIILKYFLAWE